MMKPVETLRSKKEESSCSGWQRERRTRGGWHSERTPTALRRAAEGGRTW